MVTLRKQTFDEMQQNGLWVPLLLSKSLNLGSFRGKGRMAVQDGRRLGRHLSILVVATGLRSASPQDRLESAGHVLGNFEDHDLRRSSGFCAVGNAEEVAVTAHLDQTDCNRG